MFLLCLMVYFSVSDENAFDISLCPSLSLSLFFCLSLALSLTLSLFLLLLNYASEKQHLKSMACIMGKKCADLHGYVYLHMH